MTAIGVVFSKIKAHRRQTGRLSTQISGNQTQDSPNQATQTPTQVAAHIRAKPVGCLLVAKGRTIQVVY